jgi:hypothetical protein
MYENYICIHINVYVYIYVELNISTHAHKFHICIEIKYIPKLVPTAMQVGFTHIYIYIYIQLHTNL